MTPKKGLKTAAWFPPQERVTATSISQMLNNVGQGVSFLVASLMVEEPGNGTGLVNSTSPGPGVEEVRAQLQHYLLLLAVPAITTFLLALLYFPSKPPTAPSRSSQEPRLDFATGVKQLVTLTSHHQWSTITMPSSKYTMFQAFIKYTMFQAKKSNG